MRIFEIPTGERRTITTDIVNVQMEDLKTSGVTRTDVSYDATATDRYMTDYKGVRRRLFTDTSISFGGLNEIWLSDSQSNGSEQDAEWPDEI